eukprot:CAMPEP_0119105244 /NCGR_PEP_ID=MMETSP1180-20130426/3266_1 /TAXON_ID=3052 ORGANISM="Chlamydomonas cf sp, Strain CCMP681" /NCGR_SAMPLE_ID=MMETSP1180 /ASSEMBLY_ACC=CAM_ASM_000741 /LENGTH=83 /DNA_ID=CAMNT_0007090251 /DNA_START=407 /DNA_END=655 /DNA_ORIENTATION=-
MTQFFGKIEFEMAPACRSAIKSATINDVDKNVIYQSGYPTGILRLTDLQLNATAIGTGAKFCFQMYTGFSNPSGSECSTPAGL